MCALPETLNSESSEGLALAVHWLRMAQEKISIPAGGSLIFVGNYLFGVLIAHHMFANQWLFRPDAHGDSEAD